MQNKLKKYIVGLTGGIGSGKTTVSEIFANKGVDIVDADLIAREVVEPGTAGLQKIQASFGKHLVNNLGQLDRAALRELVFNDEHKKQTLNKILHPIIRKTILNQLQATQSQYCILSAPLLFENELHNITHRNVIVDISEEMQISRTLLRDGGDVATIKNIMKAQIAREKRYQLADDIIDNSKDKHWLIEQVNTLHQQYLKDSTKLTW